ncbi:hypothetical protein PHSY_001325 [Pseudozyma hubeiensis SY62]|uniref:Uncharacterized protein n=1 Tax=Pseudozyma hubeiensis (strain SY62) TaxID=1305764 RepID=R9P6P3_PSEHS|nr:hypothetical protein PHSY_001325 [Pseudozyma hubeiensis SY62]GAC93760.1 hypothetical protein PHSY_001325 [Pseudozyma hubeiensis SY62]
MDKLRCRQHRSSAARSPGPQESLARPRQCVPSPSVRFKRTQSRQYMDTDWAGQPLWRALLQGRDTCREVKLDKHAVCLSGQNSCDRQDGTKLPNRLPDLSLSPWPPTTGQERADAPSFRPCTEASDFNSRLVPRRTRETDDRSSISMLNAFVSHAVSHLAWRVHFEATPRYGPQFGYRSGILQLSLQCARFCVRKRRSREDLLMEAVEDRFLMHRRTKTDVVVTIH